MTRIEQVIPHDSMGGMQEVAHLLDESLPAQGIESRVVDLSQVTGGRPGRIGTLQAWDDLRRRFRTSAPDVVMAHTVLNAVYSLSAARAAGVPSRVLVVHATRESLGRVRTLATMALLATGTVTRLVHVGTTAADSFDRELRPWRRRRVTIQNGVRLPEMTSRPAAPEESALQLVTAGRLVDTKNIGTLVRAVAACTQPVQLHVLGDGEQRDELQRLADDLAAPVTFHGAVPREELAVRYAQADLFCFPTVLEGLPLVLIEAASAGLPVLASDMPFNREVMADAATYVPADDVTSWTTAIDALAQDGSRREAMRASGLERSTHFAAGRMVADYARMVREEVTARHAPSQP